MTGILEDVKRQVAIANRILSAMGLATGHRLSLGHASMRVPEKPDQFVVKGRGYKLDALPAKLPENMILCDTEGRMLDGPPGSTQCFEVKIHSCVYKTRPEVNAVVHVHPTFVVLMSVLGRTIRPMAQEGVQLVAKPLPVYPHTRTVQSDEEGMEATPVWALTGPFQHHITGCIGFAFWQYYLVTGDKKWLETRGYPLLKEVADFWCSRVERNGAGHYDIKNVIGADEYAENRDNNAFTNGVAIASLRAAIKAAQVLGIAPNADWDVVATNIPLPKMPNGATAEYDGYKGIEIKQADVNLLAYPLGVITDVAQVKKDLNYYEPLYDSKNGPAMGPSVLSILHSR